MRALSGLISEDDAWAQVETWLAAATNEVEVLPAEESARSAALFEVQVTTRSTMGAVVYHSGGLLVDHGWIRILGSSHPGLPRSLSGWNRRVAPYGKTTPDGFYLVADDVVGGFFALDGGGLGSGDGRVYYFAPDTISWESLDRGYSDFLYWCLAGNLGAYYETFRWPGWQADVRELAGDRAFSFYPPPFSREFTERTPDRRAVPVDELYRLYVDDGYGGLVGGVVEPPTR